MSKAQGSLERQKPPTPPTVALDMEDSMEELGDRIASLTLIEAAELARYLTRKVKG
jgi:hypothetical protein